VLKSVSLAIEHEGGENQSIYMQGYPKEILYDSQMHVFRSMTLAVYVDMPVKAEDPDQSWVD
jgi:hypothetical protein